MGDLSFIKRHFLVDRRRIADLRFILESYDGLAFVRSLDGMAGLVEIAYPHSRRSDAEALLHALTLELDMEPAEPPAPGTYPPI